MKENSYLRAYTDDECDLSRCDEIWNGWRVKGRRLISPESWEFSPGRILASVIDREQLVALRAELRTAREMRHAYSPRLTQWHTLRAALRALESDIRCDGSDIELEELRELTRETRTVQR